MRPELSNRCSPAQACKGFGLDTCPVQRQLVIEVAAGSMASISNIECAYAEDAPYS